MLYAPCTACYFVPFDGTYLKVEKYGRTAPRVFKVARARQIGENGQIKSRRRCVKSEKAARANPARFYVALASMIKSAALL